MADYEKRFIRDGVPVPIQCIMMNQDKRRENLRFHYHDYTELLFGVEGVADVYVGNKNYKLSEGDVVIVHNFELHDVTGTDSFAKYIVIKFLPSVLLSVEQTYSEYSYALCLMQNTDKRQSYFTKSEFESTEIAKLFHHAMSEWDGGQFGYELSLRSDVMAIFLFILRKWHSCNIQNEPVNKWHGELIQNAINYINKNYPDATETSLSQALGVSPSYFSRVFKKGMKQNFTSYLNFVKLREAERMLVSTDMSVTEVGERVGFSTSAYFIANFKKAYKMTPSKYRKLLRGED